MSDRRLRSLERAYRAADDPREEGRYLRERVRLGSLAPDRLALARALGAPALGGDEHPPLGFQDWLDALPFRSRRGRLERDFARVPLAIARALTPLAHALGVERGALDKALDDAERTLAVARSPRSRQHRGANRLVHGAPYDTRPLLAFLGWTLEELAGRGRGPVGYERTARRALYPRYPDLEAQVEAAFCSGQGRLWALRVAVRDALLP